ncbi:MAG: TonB family protein [bacterium]|nr:TonB family protein [bacterium]
MNLKVKKRKYKNKFLFGLFFSLFVHSLFGYYLVYDFHHKVIDVKVVNIEEVEFLEKEKVIKKRLKVEERKEKVAKKAQKKAKKQATKKLEEKYKKQKPLLKDKKLIEKKTLNLKIKKKELQPKKLDIKLKRKTSMKVRTIDNAPKLIERKRHTLNAQEVEKLLNINEVGDKKISQKTLQLANKLKEEIRVKKFADTPKVALKEKNVNLVKLDKKIESFDSAPDINLSQKEIEPNKGLVKTKRVSSGFDVNDMTILEEKEMVKSQKVKKVAIVDDRPIKVIQEKPVEVAPVVEKKIKKVEASIIKKRKHRLKEVNGRHKRKKKKDFEILGAIKNRVIKYSVIPKYPEWAKAEGVEANVRVYIEVDKHGSVLGDTARIDITSGYQKLDEYVLEVIKQWMFVPIEKDEIQNGTITFKFKLY